MPLCCVLLLCAAAACLCEIHFMCCRTCNQANFLRGAAPLPPTEWLWCGPWQERAFEGGAGPRYSAREYNLSTLRDAIDQEEEAQIADPQCGP